MKSCLQEKSKEKKAVPGKKEDDKGKKKLTVVEQQVRVASVDVTVVQVTSDVSQVYLRRATKLCDSNAAMFCINDVGLFLHSNMDILGQDSPVFRSLFLCFRSLWPFFCGLIFVRVRPVQGLPCMFALFIACFLTPCIILLSRAFVMFYII